MFTDVERKLIALALNEAAQPGEVQNGAVMLFQSLRKRGVRPEALFADPPAAEPVWPEWRYAAFVMPFGRHRGERLGNIPPAYLYWVLDRCNNASPTLKHAIRAVLAGAN